MPLTITRRRLDSLRHYPGNARRGDTEAIAESLARNGQYRPLVVQASTGFVLTGNHTMDAAALACVHCPHTRRQHDEAGTCTQGDDTCPGFTPHAELDVTELDVDDDAARRIVIADNRTADLGGYDERALLTLLRDLGEDLTGTGYDTDDYDDLLAAIEEADADNPPEPPTALIPGQAPGGAYAGSENEGVRYKASYGEKEAAYLAGSSRFIALNYPLAQYQWVVERLGRIGAEERTDNFADTVLRLVAARTGEEPPPLADGETTAATAPTAEEVGA